MNYLIFLGLIFLSLHSRAQVRQPPVPPVFEDCRKIAIVTNGGKQTQQIDPVCKANNNTKQNDYNAAVATYNSYLSSMNNSQVMAENPGSAPTALVVPQPPVLESCGSDQACQARNQVKERAYADQLSSYSQAKQRQDQLDQQKLAQQGGATSAKAEAEAAQNKNKKGSVIYKIASAAAAAASAVYAAKFAASCSTTCNKGFLVRSIFFAVMSGLGAKQASSHDKVAHAACLTAGRLASEGGACGGAPSPYNPATFPNAQAAELGTIFSQDGQCIGNAEDCERVISNLPPGVNIKDALKNLNSFASSSAAGKGLFKTDKDGNIITKDGKVYTPENFSSVKAMMDAGMSEVDAKELFAGLSKNNVAVDAKDILAKEKIKGFDTSAAFKEPTGVGGFSSAVNSSVLNGNIDIGGKASREPATAEGLAKGFNGELIGVAGDDIFKMMNRRYKLKTAQDSFITP